MRAMPIDLRLDPAEIALLTDLYELTVSAAFFDHGMNDAAAFELALRRLPPGRGYMVAAGIDRLADVLEEYRFSEAALTHLESLALFKPAFLDYLAKFRFSGSMRALPEGAVFFAGEPILEISAPLIEAQLIETVALNQVGFATMAATKAARCVSVAGGRRLIDFGPRRAQGADATLIAARSSYLAGFHGTANVLAGARYGIPVFGTMSHSFIMAHDSERAAFDHFVESFPKLSTLLVDTYDTVRGVTNAAAVGVKMREAGLKVQAIRLDSGELPDLSRRARRVLDQAGLKDVAIFASGNLDEYKIDDLVESGAPIDAFGVGTSLAVSDDAPAGDFTYKLVEYKSVARLKTSPNKVSAPGRKQIFRGVNANGAPLGDLTGLLDEGVDTVTREFRTPPSKVTPLLEPIVLRGHRVAAPTDLGVARERIAAALAAMDPRLKTLRRPAEYPVRNTAALGAVVISEKLRAEHRQT
jgi:nicotinate phosphoribosyltransferase